MENIIIDNNNSCNSIVLSSKIRLSRNLKDINFPNKLDVEEARDVAKKIINSVDDNNYKSIYLWENDNSINRKYLNEDLINLSLLENSNKSAVMINNDENMSIMINGNDHIKIQSKIHGLNLREAYDKADELDNELEQNLEFAFDEKLGYLTSSLTNIGTALRASVILHLPALVIKNEIEQIFSTISHLGMTIKGIYGERYKSNGNLFEVLNEVTLGSSEREILTNLIAVVKQIIAQEKDARSKILKKYKYELEDKIYRSLGILNCAVILSFNECLKFLSYVRMGIEMGIIKNINVETLDKLLIEIQPTLIKNKNKNLNTKKLIDIERANIVRQSLNLEL